MPALRKLKDHTIGFDAKQLELLWIDLASEQAGKAYHAEFALAVAQAVPFLKEHLTPVRPIDPKRVEKLIADLDSEEFAVRDKAAKELVKVADQIEPALNKAKKTNSSPEVQRRIGAILSGPYVPPTGERLRVIRAIAAVERIGTREARDVLRRLAEGDPTARETREANEALARLH
jgi:hypothetical protein